ncbi:MULTISPECIES: hypothetical protein [Alphaproteobacteria]|jgi:prophage maintenance system killer protein|uniref:Death on curing protein n=1 Tax=Maricaulis virginensis TaxID=144022 RepID=A0A9W6MPT8_9PROT|nr:hypothetical protein [Maricaulis virginensis]GLK53965.1 hypothetical protein GCM10017621_34730 [Maricaulis virginensis]
MTIIRLERDVVRAIYFLASQFAEGRQGCPSRALDRVEECLASPAEDVAHLAADLAVAVLRERVFPIANTQTAWLLAHTLLSVNGHAVQLEQTDAVFLMLDVQRGAIGRRQLAAALKYGRNIPVETAA